MRIFTLGLPGAGSGYFNIRNEGLVASDCEVFHRGSFAGIRLDASENGCLAHGGHLILIGFLLDEDDEYNARELGYGVCSGRALQSEDNFTVETNSWTPLGVRELDAELSSTKGDRQ